MVNPNDEALAKLRAESEAEEDADRNRAAARRKAQLIRTTSIGAGMCLLVGLLSGSRVLLLLPCAVIFAGGTAALAVQRGVGTHAGGLLLGGASFLVVTLTGGTAQFRGALPVALVAIPLGIAVFIGHRGETTL